MDRTIKIVEFDEHGQATVSSIHPADWPAAAKPDASKPSSATPAKAGESGAQGGSLRTNSPAIVAKLQGPSVGPKQIKIIEFGKEDSSAQIAPADHKKIKIVEF